MEQLTLFDLSSVAPAAPSPKIDPYWDEIVLSPGAVNETGQLSLLYDDSSEPPDPDDYPTVEAYNQAWQRWEEQHPALVSEVRAMSDEDDEGDRISAPEQVHEKELRIGDRFRYRTTSGQMYTLVNIRRGKPKPYTFQADDGSKFSCLHWDIVLELLSPAPEQPQPKLEPTDTSEAAKPYNCVREQVTHDTVDIVREQKPVTQQVAPEHTHWIEEYWVQRREQKYKYYRYCWMEGRKIRRCHIGGNVRSLSARQCKAAVESAIAFGESPAEIEKIIRSWRG